VRTQRSASVDVEAERSVRRRREFRASVRRRIGALRAGAPQPDPSRTRRRDRPDVDDVDPRPARGCRPGMEAQLDVSDAANDAVLQAIDDGAVPGGRVSQHLSRAFMIAIQARHGR
jgi:hypothetical protein